MRRTRLITTRPARTRTTTSTDMSSAGAPLVGLLDHPEVDEGLGVAHAVDRPQLLGQEVEEGRIVLAPDLDQDVVGAGRDHDVVDLGKRAGTYDILIEVVCEDNS